MSGDVTRLVVRHYLGSPDFNGLPLEELPAGVAPVVRSLVAEGQLEVLTSADDNNPHIRRFPAPSVDVQLKHLESPALEGLRVCVYPTTQTLGGEDVGLHDQPYRRLLALGAPQLEYKAFDLAVLEVYRNDRRYIYECSDYSGRICIADEFFEDGVTPNRDQVLLGSFGFAFNEDFRRAVAVIHRRLATLSPEHQQIWRARELDGSYKLHPQFFRTEIEGIWPDQLPIHHALLMEMATINKMAEAMGKPQFFRAIPGGTGELAGFGFLVRPTRAEFDSYVHLLDKLISENLNKDFFRGDLDLERESQRADGTVEVQQKGTLVLLDEWIRTRFRSSDYTPLDTAMATLRRVRELRQPPAHKIVPNEYNEGLFHEQRELIVRVYEAIRFVRHVFSHHPGARGVEVRAELRDREVCDY